MLKRQHAKTYQCAFQPNFTFAFLDFLLGGKNIDFKDWNKQSIVVASETNLRVITLHSDARIVEAWWWECLMVHVSKIFHFHALHSLMLWKAMKCILGTRPRHGDVFFCVRLKSRQSVFCNTRGSLWRSYNVWSAQVKTDHKQESVCPVLSSFFA